MIALIDYGAGNLHSVEKALRFLGAKIERVTRPEPLDLADAAVLPGVGAFDDCMHTLANQNLVEATRRFIDSRRPFLGICVGYQALFERSEEFQSTASGLRTFAGTVVRFPGDCGLKVPQIGWNQVELTGDGGPLFRGISSGTYFYFVHSYYPQPDDDSIVVGRTQYGANFASAIWKENVYATQFHPEKSQKAGLQLLQNFVNLVE